jgi:hypothetical protein
MRKTILRILGASLITAATVQIAGATERHNNARSVAEMSISERARNSHAYAPPAAFAAEPEWSRYSGGISAPAGR